MMSCTEAMPGYPIDEVTSKINYRNEFHICHQQSYGISEKSIIVFAYAGRIRDPAAQMQSLG